MIQSQALKACRVNLGSTWGQPGVNLGALNLHRPTGVALELADHGSERGVRHERAARRRLGGAHVEVESKV